MNNDIKPIYTQYYMGEKSSHIGRLFVRSYLHGALISTQYCRCYNCYYSSAINPESHDYTS